MTCSDAISDPETVVNKGWVGGIDLSASPLGSSYFSVTASIDDNPLTYTLSLYDGSGSRVCSKSSYDRGCSDLVSRPSSGSVTYTAYVAQDSPLTAPPTDDVRGMSSVQMNSDGSVDTTSNGVATSAILSLLSTASDEDIEAMWLAWDASGLGIHVEESELTDQHLGYDELRTTGGKSVAEAMSAIIKTVAGLSVGAVLVWYLIKFFSPSATQPAAPVNPNPPTATATAPTPVTGTVSYLDLVTEDFIKHNPKEMTWPDAQAGARTCIQDTEWAIGVGALTGSNATDPCQNQFIYLPSSEYPETTSHNWDAIQSYPAWIRLNYVSNADRKAAPLSRTWYSSYTPCSTNTDSTKSCDEYPFFSSAQSGPNSRGTGNEASLRVVDALQNSLAGSRYGNFVRRTDCDLTSGGPTASPSSPSGTAFLVIPMDFENAPRTFEVCN